MKERLLASDDLKPGESRRVEAGTLALLLVRTQDGEVYALRDRCPHQGARLSHGRLLAHVEAADVGDYTLGDATVIRCPWHGMEYDVATGLCPADDSIRVPTFEVIVEDGQILLDRGDAGR